MIYQRTIGEQVSVTGVGLHSGCRVNLTLKPAKENNGIIFVRVDLKNQPSIKCHPFLINDTRLSSTLIDDNGVRIATVEHLLSSFACLGIDNIIVEISASEIPIMDGSSNSFLFLLDQAEIKELKAKKKYIKINNVVEVIDNDKWVKLSPFNGFKVKYTMQYDHPLFTKEKSEYEIDFSKQSYISELSRARTFAFMKDIEKIRKNGLGLGGNLHNAIIIDDETILNQDGLRYENEFVKHKILDVIGDLYINGHQIIGAFEGYKSGHETNNKLLRKILNTPSAWEYVEFDNEQSAPNSFHYLT